jgi:hypothetical protein
MCRNAGAPILHLMSGVSLRSGRGGGGDIPGLVNYLTGLPYMSWPRARIIIKKGGGRGVCSPRVKCPRYMMLPSFENSSEISLCRVLVLITSLELEERDTGRNVSGSAELKGTGPRDILTKMDTSTSTGFLTFEMSL